MNTDFTVKICFHEQETDKLRQALSQARTSSTSALTLAFTVKINPELVERAQARVFDMKREMQMALAASKRNEMRCCAFNSDYDTLKSEIMSFVKLMESNMRRLHKAN